MHGIYKTESLADAAFAQAGINLGRDIDEPPAAGNVEPEFLSIATFIRSSVTLVRMSVGRGWSIPKMTLAEFSLAHFVGRSRCVSLVPEVSSLDLRSHPPIS
jgi:hypothetical protein